MKKKKKQFRGEKVLRPHFFFNVKKAYDSVWHARLHYKLTNVGITGVLYQYLQNSYPKDIFVCE